MRSPRFFLCLVFVAFAGFPQLAHTQIIVDPGPTNSSVPACIGIMGHNGSGVLDPLSQFTVIHRDLANNPIAGAMIVIDFSAVGELRLCADDHDPNVIVDCAARTVSRLTDANGVATFRIAGWSLAAPATPGSPYNDGKIFANGILLGSPTIQIYDLDRNGLGASDLSFWLSDFFSGNNAARGDYDCTGSLGAGDLSRWLTVYFASGSSANCSPEGPCP